MAAPAPTARSLPTGWKMPDGYKTLITLSNKPAISLWEKSVKPPAIDGGDPIETTTMHNTTVHTMEPRSLKKIGEVSAPCAYDPDVWTDIMGQVNINQTVTVTYPDHTTLAAYGYLQKFEPGEHKEGEQPEAAVTIVITNWDPVNRVEAVPVLAAAPGT